MSAQMNKPFQVGTRLEDQGEHSDRPFPCGLTGSDELVTLITENGIFPSAISESDKLDLFHVS